MKEKSAPTETGRSQKHIVMKLVAIVVVIVVINHDRNAKRRPSFVPPAMSLFSAAFPRLVQNRGARRPLACCSSRVLHGFVESVVGFGDAALALIVTFRQMPWVHLPDAIIPTSAAVASITLVRNYLLPFFVWSWFLILHVSPLLEGRPQAMKHCAGENVARVRPHS